MGGNNVGQTLAESLFFHGGVSESQRDVGDGWWWPAWAGGHGSARASRVRVAGSRVACEPGLLSTRLTTVRARRARTRARVRLHGAHTRFFESLTG